MEKKSPEQKEVENLLARRRALVDIVHPENLTKEYKEQIKKWLDKLKRNRLITEQEYHDQLFAIGYEDFLKGSEYDIHLPDEQ